MLKVVAFNICFCSFNPVDMEGQSKCVALWVYHLPYRILWHTTHFAKCSRPSGYLIYRKCTYKLFMNKSTVCEANRLNRFIVKALKKLREKQGFKLHTVEMRGSQNIYGSCDKKINCIEIWASQWLSPHDTPVIWYSSDSELISHQRKRETQRERQRPWGHRAQRDRRHACDCQAQSHRYIVIWFNVIITSTLPDRWCFLTLAET